MSPIAALQRTAGNHAIHRLVSAAIQPKLTVNPPDDTYEREADRVADEVMRMPAAPPAIERRSLTLQRKCHACETAAAEDNRSDHAQRKCAACAQEEENSEDEPRLQAKHADGAAPAMTPDVDAYVRSRAGGGRPLDAGTRLDLEARLGHDFAHVRVHDDTAAAASARAINARAYTFGHHVVFGAGEFAPATPGGRRLLAHELTHVVQQGGRGTGLMPHIQRQTGIARGVEIALSEMSPGRIDVSPTPPMISLYNFAIDKSTLKDEHRNALNVLGVVLKQAAGAKLHITANGHADVTGDEKKINAPLSRSRVMAVRALLQTVSGLAVDPNWYGATKPAATNDTVEGRSRNRRVDIFLILEKKKDGKKDGEKDGDGDGGGGDGNGGGGGGGGNGDGDGDGWSLPIPCQGPLGVLFCGLVACALAPEVCLFCIENPRICLGGPKPPKKPKRPKEKKERPCVVSFSITPPDPVITARTMPASGLGAIVMGAFQMHLLFKNDDTGCTCARGEYRQEIRGFAERDKGTGVMQRADPAGMTLDTWLYQEDLREGRYPYGLRSVAIGNTDRDSFTPEPRATGCKYEGADNPGMTGGTPGEHMRFRFQFRGAPVDRDDRTTPLLPWREWVVEGDYIVPHTA